MRQGQHRLVSLAISGRTVFVFFSAPPRRSGKKLVVFTIRVSRTFASPPDRNPHKFTAVLYLVPLERNPPSPPDEPGGATTKPDTCLLYIEMMDK